MAQKHKLHELLKQTQEPFHLNTYISNKRSLLNNKPSHLTIASQAKRATNLQHQNSPAESPAAVLLRVSPKTADILLESAVRIQKSKPQPQIKSVGLGFFGAFLKLLKDRSKCKRILRNFEADERKEFGGDIISGGLSGGDREARPSTCRQHEELDQIGTGDFGLLETQFRASPFRFSFSQSSSSSGYHTPEFCSPVVSPSRRRVNQEKENYTTGENTDDVNVVVDEEKEQCSPVSVLDPFFEDDVHESRDEEEEDDDYDLECSYANMQRTKQQLLDRLRRFEKLAELDPMELERNFLEDSDDEHERESVVSEDDHEPSYEKQSLNRFLNDDQKPSYEKQSLDRFLNEAFCLSNLQHSSRKMCTDEKRLVLGLMVEKKSKITCFGDKEIVLELDMVETMVEFGLKRGFEGWDETVEEIEVAIFGQLLEEFVLHG